MPIYNKNIPSNPNFGEQEKTILEFWQNNKVFEKSLEKNNRNDSFVFYDGPPFANGLPHYGHLLTSCVKDTVGRFQTMDGKFVARRFGWDCHGLPAEMAAEKALSVSGRKAIEEYGIKKFNDYCQSSVMEYATEWRKYMDRIARWVDMDNAYKTMDTNFMESVIWGFKCLYDKGLVYEEMRVMPYSWACQTPLSNFETRLDNSYRQKESKSVTVKFELKVLPNSIATLAKKAYVLVWTTTPWTLPSNLALAINQNLEYEFVVHEEIVYISCNIKNYLKDLNIVSKESEAKNTKKNAENTIKTYSISGKELIGINYKPLFDFFIEKASENAFKIYHGDFVAAESGTGSVHIAPGFGEDDFELCKSKAIGIKVLDGSSKETRLMPAIPVGDGGKFTTEISNWHGLHVFEANDEIIKALKNNGNWLKTEQYLHQYPHCWRTDTPIIYRAMPSFYIRVSQARDRLCELNKEINWMPESVKDGLFGNWLKEARDWSVSRNRFFGTPIPVWKSTDSRYPCVKVFGSIAELEEFFGEYYSKTHDGQKLIIKDLHRQFVDELTAPNYNDPTGQSMLKRIPDVFDCWFESGAMSFAEVHYPFNKNSYEGVEYTNSNFKPEDNPPRRLPADFIVEYTAQTRGWFYTLMVLSTLIFDKIPFKNCICHGVILDENKQKLSKRLQNYIDPLQAMNQYSADALRYVMLSSSVMTGGELLVDKDGKMLEEALRLIHQPLWSALRFFTMYAKEDKPQLKLISLSNIEDKFSNSNSFSGEYDDNFIIIRTRAFSNKIYTCLKNYQISEAYKEIREFSDDLNNCYIRWNRDRFWGNDADISKSSAYNSLYTALYYLSISIAPVLPFLAEMIFQTLQNDETQSVHLMSFDINSKKVIDHQTNTIKNHHSIVKLFHALKNIDHSVGSLRDDKLKIRRRQPLKKITIFTNRTDLRFENIDIKNNLFTHKILEITNCKEIELVFISSKNDYEYKDYFTRELKLNIRLLGKKYGNKLRDIQTALLQGNYINSQNNSVTINNYALNEDEFFWEVKISAKYQNQTAIAHNEGNDFLVVSLDNNLDDNLIHEGMMRDVIRAVQDARKKHLNISDRIELHLYSCEEKVIQACEKFAAKIIQETLVKDYNHLHIYPILSSFYSKEAQDFEKRLTSQNMAIFGYQVENAMTKTSYDLKLCYRVV